MNKLTLLITATMLAAMVPMNASAVIAGQSAAPDELAPEPSLFDGLDDLRALIRDSFYRQNFRTVLGKDARSYHGAYMIATSTHGDMPDFAVGVMATLGTRDGLPAIVKYEIVSDALSLPLEQVIPTKSIFDAFPTGNPLSAHSAADAHYHASALDRLLSEIDERAKALRVESCAVEIDEALSQRIDQIWSKMLRRVRYDVLFDVDYSSRYMKQPRMFYRFFGSIDRSFGFLDDGYTQSEQVAGMISEPAESTKPGQLVAAALAMRDYCRTKDKKYLDGLTQHLDDIERRLENAEQRQE